MQILSVIIIIRSISPIKSKKNYLIRDIWKFEPRASFSTWSNRKNDNSLVLEMLDGALINTLFLDAFPMSLC